MKFLIILFAVLGLFACQSQSQAQDKDRTNNYHLKYSSYRSGHHNSAIYRNQRRLQIIDSIFSKIKQFTEELISLLERIKTISDQFEFKGLSEMISKMIEALKKITNNIGGPEHITMDRPNSSLFPQFPKLPTMPVSQSPSSSICQPNDPRPQCKWG